MKLEAFNRIIAAITDAYTGSASELIEYEIRTSKYWILMFIGVIIFCAVGVSVTIWADRKYSLSMEVWPTLVYAFGGLVILILAIAVFVQIHDIYMAKYFPETMVMQYIKHAITYLEF